MDWDTSHSCKNPLKVEQAIIMAQKPTAKDSFFKVLTKNMTDSCPKSCKPLKAMKSSWRPWQIHVLKGANH